MPADPLPPTIAVIGAGPAGASAARSLRDAGLTPVVFDKGTNPGGRCSTRRSPAPGFDHGAQTLPRPDALPRTIAEAPDLLKPWAGSHLTLSRHGTQHRRTEPPLVPTPGMHALTDRLLDGIDTRCSITIASIEPSPSGITLVDANGDRLGPFDRVIVAVPAPQAATLLATPAPELADAAARAATNPCWAAMIRTRPLPDRQLASISLEDHPVAAWIARDSSKPGRPAADIDHWVLHASADWSRTNLELDKPEAAPRLQVAFLDALATLGLEPDVIDCHAHRWRYAFTAEPLGVSHLMDERAAIALAGDWLLGDRIQHATASGQAAAEAITAARR